ncbi:hypothetical protein JCM10296v2_007861 [Rhodotorula toruloides]
MPSNEQDHLEQQFDLAVYGVRGALRRRPLFGVEEERTCEAWEGIAWGVYLALWHNQGGPKKQLVSKRDLIREIGTLGSEIQQRIVGPKELLPRIVSDPRSILTTIVCGRYIRADYLLCAIEDWSEKVHCPAAQAVDHQWVAATRAQYAIPSVHDSENRWAWHGWNDAEKVALIRHLLLHLTEVLSPVAIKQEDVTQEDRSRRKAREVCGSSAKTTVRRTSTATPIALAAKAGAASQG